METERTDVVVVGAGMGGLVASVQALENGADVTVLEKGPNPGGSVNYAGGVIWTSESLEDAREYVPNGDPELHALVIDALEDGLDWLEDHDVEFMDEVEEADIPGTGRQMEPQAFIETLVSEIEDYGGELRMRTPMQELLTGEDGSVQGVVAEDLEEGKKIRIESPSVVLATGGFQGSEKLVQQFVVDNVDDLWLRSNPWSTGDGFKTAVDVGAKTTGGLNHFYGHNLVAPPAEFSPMEFRDASQYYGTAAVALDVDGRRFTDESESELESTIAQDTAKIAGGRAYYVVDRDLYRSEGKQSNIGEKVENAREFGGRVGEVDSLDELADLLSEWGVRGERAVETIREFNDAVREGSAADLDPPREDNQHTIDTPPYYVVEVQPGITFTSGGLKVDLDMAVLRETASTSNIENPETTRGSGSTPIGGLYAAGVDVGEFNARHYIGGLSFGLVSGRIAGERAASRSSR